MNYLLVTFIREQHEVKPMMLYDKIMFNKVNRNFCFAFYNMVQVI